MKIEVSKSISRGDFWKFLPGRSHLSSKNSIQLARAASPYSLLWLSKNESRDSVRELTIAVTKNSEKWKTAMITMYLKYQNKIC